ncbi:AAA domain-containing protein [Shivajiella indica]|uniref:AAA domain-containing protein n=1 Tax=Shivajiella indica TaxID=872115 RepID=A0ABW5BDR7_9BACT
MSKEIFQIYLNRLIDLSSRNRSLYLPRLISSQMVDLNDLNFLNHHPTFEYIENLLSRKRHFPLIDYADARNESINLLSQRLRRLQGFVQTAESETGEKNLYVAWPFVEGKLLNGQVVRCPLVFFPVELEKEKNHWQLVKNVGDQPFFNKTFLLAYAQAYGLKLPGVNDENPMEDFSKDSIGFRNDLYQYLKKEFSVNFTAELYENTVKNFPDSSKSLDENSFKTGKLELKSYAVLGQFSQKTSFLIQDYEELIENGEYEDLESLFFNYFNSGEDLYQIVREDQLYTSFPLDASQEQVLKAVRAGKSAVVEGPPGTGKSQLICNLALDFISRGKRVLVVSQKRAALDVVFKRLDEQGFGPFAALVHDFRADKKNLFKKIHDQILSLDNFKDLNRSIDTIQLERQFSQVSRAIESHAEFFNDYKKALFNTEECDVPVKELYLSSKMSDEFFDLTQHYKKITFSDVERFLNDLKEYSYYYKKFQKTESFWLHRINFSSFGPSVPKRIQGILDEINNSKQKIELRFKENAGFDSSFLFILFEQKEKLEHLYHFLLKEETREIFGNIREVEAGKIDLLWLEQKMETVKGLLSEEGVEWFSQDSEVEPLLSKALAFQNRGKGIWDKLTWPIKRKKFEQVFEALDKNSLPLDEYGNKILIQKLDNRLNMNHQYSLLSAKEWLHLPPKPFDFTHFNHFAKSHLDAIKSKLIIHEWGVLGDFLLEQSKEKNNLLDIVEFFSQEIRKLDELMPKWTLYLSKVQIQHLFMKCTSNEINEIKVQIPFVFDDLVAFDTLRNRLSLEDRDLMEKLFDQNATVPFEQIQEQFLTGLKFAWIEHIETKYPILKEISTPKALNYQSELMRNIQEKMKLSKFISELRVREIALRNIEYNRLGNMLTYRELSHQVNKQRRLWSIKKIVEEFEHEVFKLVPCWLASPETVSALFPLKQSFDLVIFDESSQCYVERGFPAMLRGKQVVVAGDSQQLQPFDLYQVRLDLEEEGIETETDSLLDFVSKFFQKFWLEGHYRSSQLALIQFSNQHFYENRLSMLPDMHLENNKVNPFFLIKVNGIWEKHMNRAEAEKVVEEIIKIQEKFPDDSIGVITFNYFQMELIREMIENDHQVNLKSVAVKNIENVQGDEFDRVIFSIGYAKNKVGKLIANFGLLSKNGGINRLNVAVTRAKKTITLITSLNSRDFKTDQLRNEGVRMLRDYIAFVENLVEGKPLDVLERKIPGYEWSWFLNNILLKEKTSHEFEKFQDSSCMDLAEKKKGFFLKAILTDDKRFYMSDGAKEAFAYLPIHLKEKNWPFQFYFSRQYWMGRALDDIGN